MTDETPATDIPQKLPTTSENAPQEAREQADAYDSIFGTVDLVLDDGSIVKIPPHPDYGMIDDDRVDDYNELMFAMDTLYDRDPDVVRPEQHLKNPDGTASGIVLPSVTSRGALKAPYRQGGVLIKPAHTIKIVMAALGEVEYKRLREGGRNAGDVWKIWGDQARKVRERQAGDSKSQGSAVAVAPVPPADS